MNAELQAAEAKYAPRFAEAEQIPDENQRRARIEGLRNSFGTKQSMIRKKYGVRLRERRTKAEITAERERLGIKRAERAKASAAAAAAAAAKRRNSTPSSNAEAAPRPAGGSGWTAANTTRANAVWDEHGAKRRRVDEAGGYQTPYQTPYGPVADETAALRTLSVSEIGGGLSGASATAATHDPTLPPLSQPARVYEQSGARVEIHEPVRADDGRPADAPAVKSEPGSETATPAGSYDGRSRGSSAGAHALSGQQQPVVAADDDDNSSSDDEDIPSTLPAHVKKTLASSGTGLLERTP